MSLGCAGLSNREWWQGEVVDISASPREARVGEQVSIEVEFDTYKERVRDPFTGDSTDELEPDDNGLVILLPLGLKYVPESAEFNAGLEPSGFNKRAPDSIVTCDEGTPPGTLPVNAGRQAILFDFPGGISLSTNIARLRFRGIVSKPSGEGEIEVSLREDHGTRACFYRGDGIIDRRRSVELLP